jgi:hypothetical protein
VTASSSDQAPGGSLRRTPSASLCHPNGDDNAEKPHSSGELDGLISGYVIRCDRKLFAALDEIYANEERNEAWASKLEAKVAELKLTEPLARMRIDGGCRSSLCRFDFEPSGPEGCTRLVGHEFDRSILDSTGGTDLEVTILWRTKPIGCTRYIYSTIMPPAFLEPLLQRMKD